MEKETPEPRIVAEDYRLSRGPDGLKIEVLEYHAEPLLLTDSLLKRLGLAIVERDTDDA